MPKLTIPSPSMVHYRSGRPYIDTRRTRTWTGSGATSAPPTRRRSRQLHELGCTYLQMDDTCFAYLNDASQRERDRRARRGRRDLHLRYIKQINEAVADKPEDMTLTVHMCRGNFRSSWVAEGGYDYVAEPLLSELDVDGYFMEFDDDRSGGFEPLRFVPKGKFIVLGLVTSKRPSSSRRTRSSAGSRPPASTCRWSSSASPRSAASRRPSRATRSRSRRQKAKLRLVVEIADEVWG